MKDPIDSKEIDTEKRNAKFERVLEQRTRYLTAVIEDLYQAHNGGAVVRACECLGIQDLHVIANRHHFQVSEEVSLGASRWLTMRHFREKKDHSTAVCFRHLKAKGYTIYATTLRQGAIPLNEIDISQKTALCFGTEEKGLSETAHQMADGFVQIPMYGMTQSFNISVSLALAFSELTQRLKKSQVPWQLSDEEKADLKKQWTDGGGLGFNELPKEKL